VLAVIRRAALDIARDIRVGGED
jgi:hypothetical protein